MVIERLSDITFTNWADVVPSSGVEAIFNTSLTNTLAGNDTITGISFGNRFSNSSYGIYNSSTLNTAEGNDIVMGVYNPTRYSSYGVYFGLLNNTENIILDNDDSPYLNNDGNIMLPYGYGIYNLSTLVTGEDDDIIRGTNTAEVEGIYDPMGLVGIYNLGTINTGNGTDSLISDGKFINLGDVLLGEGNDSIEVYTNLSTYAIENYTTIETGNGNDIITSYGFIYNEGTIDTGNGNDSIITNKGFWSDVNNLGSVLLGEGEDYIKGFGNGNFYGGDGNDTLELTSGSYTVWIGNTSATFTKGNQFMRTFEFEKFIAGGTTYDFISLTDGQTIVS